MVKSEAVSGSEAVLRSHIRTTTGAQPKTFAIVAGEASGDILGAGLVRALKQSCPDARFIGIGGPLMIAEGFETLFPMDRLAVMGLVEVLGRLKELLGIRRQLRETFTSQPPSVFIGIDAPDFNLGLEKSLRTAGIPTVHYVSPSVWAWRKKRVLKIREAVDHMLCLLPFETEVYQQHGVAATFVGHPLADQIALEPGTAQAREALGRRPDELLIGLLPGSRGGEVKRLAPLFLDAAEQIVAVRPEVKFLLPCANPARRQQLEALLQERAAQLPITLYDGQSHEVMTAVDALLMASGTAALEGLLHKKPMVISYKVNQLTYLILKQLVSIDRYSLPNLLAGHDLVPEIIQGDATPEALSQATLACLEDSDNNRAQADEYLAIHKLLRRDASVQAARAVLSVVEKADKAEKAKQPEVTA